MHAHHLAGLSFPCVAPSIDPWPAWSKTSSRFISCSTEIPRYVSNTQSSLSSRYPRNFFALQAFRCMRILKAVAPSTEPRVLSFGGNILPQAGSPMSTTCCSKLWTMIPNVHLDAASETEYQSSSEGISASRLWRRSTSRADAYSKILASSRLMLLPAVQKLTRGCLQSPLKHLKNLRIAGCCERSRTTSSPNVPRNLHILCPITPII